MKKTAPAHFLGVDLGSLYTKFAVVGPGGDLERTAVIPTLSRRREAFEETLTDLQHRYRIARNCATGYGRGSFESDLKKTELICAAAGVSFHHRTPKAIIDIGGEDIKIIDSDPRGRVTNFYMNDKCSAGTGAFITEIAEKAELEIEEMSRLAPESTSQQVINSFCTVFAKTEILGWKFDGVPLEDIARGIYLSIVNRICKLPIPTDRPLFLCGGVINYHPYLGDLLNQRLGVAVRIVDKPLYTVALGAALLARESAGGRTRSPAGGIRQKADKYRQPVDQGPSKKTTVAGSS